MNSSVKNTFKNIISSIIAIVIMFSLITTMAVLFFKTTLINENTYKNVFENIGTYDSVVENIKSNVGYILTVNNIPKDTLNEVISKDEVVDIIDSTTDSFIGFLKGKDSVVSYDIKKYKDRIDEGINSYLTENEISLSESQKNDVENMKSSILNIIDGELQIINFSELSRLDYMIIISRLVSVLNNNLVLLCFMVINILLLSSFFFIWKKRKARVYAWVGYTLVSAGLIVFLLSFSGYLSKFYEYVIIATPYVAQTVGAIIKKYLLNMSIIGAVITCMGIFSMSFYWAHLYQRYTNSSKKSVGLISE